jgi:hypothetical protein
MRIFLPGRLPAGCLMASSEACGALRRWPSQSRTGLQRQGCAPPPTGKGEEKRPPSSGDASPHPFSRLDPRDSGKSSISPAGRDNSGPFPPNRCYSAPTGKKANYYLSISAVRSVESLSTTMTSSTKEGMRESTCTMPSSSFKHGMTTVIRRSRYTDRDDNRHSTRATNNEYNNPHARGCAMQSWHGGWVSICPK